MHQVGLGCDKGIWLCRAREQEVMFLSLVVTYKAELLSCLGYEERYRHQRVRSPVW